MYQNEPGNINKNSFLFLSLKLVVPVAFAGLLFTVFSAHHKQYSSGFSTFAKQDKDKDQEKDAIGMQKYFFNARKNVTTNSMDYNSMVEADNADQALSMLRKPHSSLTVPEFNWVTMGPTNIGGRTRAILIDNTDPTHQTIFAGGVSGGIWKSTNGGGTWGNTVPTLSFSQNDQLQNMNVCSIAQDANGAIYIGTGEGFSLFDGGEAFSTEMVGGGIFKSTDDGNTWRLLKNTHPSDSNSAAVDWAFVNRIAIRPDSFQVIYAATNSGLYISHDSGATWSNTVSNTGRPLGGTTNDNALDVKISKDGSVVIAEIGNSAFSYYCYPQSGADNVFTQVASSGLGKLPGNASRIEYAIAPTDANRIYASVINSGGGFGSGGSGSGIYMTENAKTNGGYWYLIGPGGSEDFNPYADQATYDNTMAVSPVNEGVLFIGGTTLWQWQELAANDSTGTWYPVSHYFSYGLGDPLYVHPDEHAIVFDDNNPNTAYFGCDGGMFVCNNILDSVDHMVFSAINRNYDVTQYYTLSYSPYVVYNTVNYGNATASEGLGLGGGTQDNGSPYINGNGGFYPNDATDLSGGDGAGSAVSSLNPNIGYFTSDNGYFERTSNLSALTFPTAAYTQSYGYYLGGDIDSIWQAAAGSGQVCFVMPCALYENSYDTLTHDSLLFTATKAYSKGDTIWPIDQNGPTTYPYILTDTLYNDSTLKVPDRVVSRIAVGFSPNYGIWINGQGASNSTVLWMPVAYGSLSKPTAFTSTTPIHCLTWSGDGDALFAGTEDGTLFRFTNLNTIIANNYASGALFYKENGFHDITTKVVSANLSFSALSGRDILSIAVDPQNGNNVLVTLGNYGSTAYVFYSSNALDTMPAPTFTSVQGNLPAMPVYSSILNLDSSGTFITNSAMIATEHGIYTTSDITQGASTKWVKNSSGLPNCLTLAIKQQTLPPWKCNNSGDIYVGTHGRGLWESTDLYQPTVTSIPTVKSTVAPNDLLIYPNPMTTQGNLEFNLANSENITITIYDMQGKVIENLPMGIQAPGNHIIPFVSSGLPAGSYFASLTGTSFKKVSKFMVVK